MITKNGIERISTEIDGDILQAPTGAVISSGIIASTASDPDNSPTTTLRAGLVMSKLSDGSLKQFGSNITTETAEDVGTGDGTTKAFVLDYGHIVPFSETIKVAGTAVSREDYNLDYFSGQLVFNTAPANGDAITADYCHITETSGSYTRDGTETPYCVLLEDVSLLNSSGVAQNTPARILLAGQIKPNTLIFAVSKTETYGRYYLSKHGFIGIPEYDY